MVKDEIGNKYGRLTVKRRVENNKRGEAQWLCECDCGKEIIVKGISLRSGHTKSCGCLQKEKVQEIGYKNTKNLIGKRFGRLVVLERISGDKNQIGKWLCKCDCGTLTEVPTNKLISGHTMSCGCLQSKGEYEISTILEKNKINFCKEYTFSDLKRIKPLRFDFALFLDNKIKCLIEYDGKQHYDNTNILYTKELEENDRAKDNYCYSNNILLYRIKYSDNIEEKMKKILEDNFLNYKAAE